MIFFIFIFSILTYQNYIKIYQFNFFDKKTILKTYYNTKTNTHLVFVAGNKIESAKNLY